MRHDITVLPEDLFIGKVISKLCLTALSALSGLTLATALESSATGPLRPTVVFNILRYTAGLKNIWAFSDLPGAYGSLSFACVSSNPDASCQKNVSGLCHNGLVDSEIVMRVPSAPVSVKWM